MKPTARRILNGLPSFALFLCLAVAQTGAQAPAKDDVTLTILHTNDMHGHIVPFAYVERGRSTQEMPDVGGAARRATAIRQIKSASDHPVLVVDAGDTFTRGPFTNLYEGIFDTEVMNAIGYDMAAIGNNEFKAKDGIEQGDALGAQAALLQVVKRSRFPWLAANVVDGNGSNPEGIQPYIIRQFGPLRIGFLGLTSPKSITYRQTRGWTIIEPIEAAKIWIPKVRAHCDVLIAVTHIGTNLDTQLASQTTGIDAIIGGDSHTFLYEPLAVKNPAGAIVPIVQDGEFGVTLGRFDLHFNKSTAGWKLSSYKEALLPIRSNLAEAPDVQAVVELFAGPMRTTVATLRQEEIGRTVAERGHLTTQIFVDALRHQSGADFAIHAEMGEMYNMFRDPVVRRLDVFATLPFKENAVIATLPGSEIQKLASAPESVVSGDIKAIDLNKMYRVAMVGFAARNTYHFPDASVVNTSRDVRDMLIEELRNRRF